MSTLFAMRVACMPNILETDVLRGKFADIDVVLAAPSSPKSKITVLTSFVEFADWPGILHSLLLPWTEFLPFPMLERRRLDSQLGLLWKLEYAGYKTKPFTSSLLSTKNWICQQVGLLGFFVF